MEYVDRRKEKVKIEGDEKLKRSLKKLRRRNEKKTDAGSYENIFNKILSDKKLMRRLRKYVLNELNNKRNEKDNNLAILDIKKALRYFKKRKFQDAMKHCNACLCYASFPPEEMARTYCFRGAVYISLELYEFCLEDLKRAESIGYPTKTKYVLDYNFSCCYYKLKKFESALQHITKDPDFQNPLSEHEKYVKSLFQNLKSMAEARIKEQEENKVKAEQETADKMMNLNIASTSNATESESMKTDEGVLLDEKNRNINTKENENVSVAFSGITERTRPRVEEIEWKNSKPNSYRTFFEILDVEDSNNSFNYSAITLNAASSYSFCQDESNLERGFSDDVEVCYNQETGFRLKAKNTLRPGTIITTDKPYVANVNPDISRYYCCYCFQRADIMMIPCNYCSEVRFCSEQCRINGWKEFHYVDCGYSGFLSRTDQTGYLCMQILLKIGVNKAASLVPLEPVGFTDHNPNLTDREEYYRFLYNLPFKNSSASNKTEAALGAVILLLFLEIMYYKISKVEEGVLGAEAIKPLPIIAGKGFLQEQKKCLGLRIVKHWLQLDVELIKVRNKRACMTDQLKIDGLYYEDTAEYVLPLLHLFNHSCDPSVYSVRFEGGPEIFRVARTISPGEFLTFAKGADIYRHNLRYRRELLKTDCDCKACNLEINGINSASSNVKELVKSLQEAEAFLRPKEIENDLKLVLELIYQKRLDSWLFWRVQRFIITALRTIHFSVNRQSGRYKPESFSVKEQSGRYKPESVIDAVKVAVQVLNNLDLLHVNLIAFIPFGLNLYQYIRMVRKLSVSAPSVLDTPNGQETLSELLKLLQHFKEKFLSISMNTHHEICISSMLRSEERSLNALIKTNKSS